MKQTVYRIKTSSSIEIELNLDINRELTEAEERFIAHSMDKLLSTIQLTNTVTSREFIQECREEREKILQLFATPIYVKEIPNEYSNSYPTPWFLVTTHKGVIKIGWRKRVIQIDWTDSDIEEETKDLLPDEDVTKFEKTIHAWGYEKAQEYISKLLK